MKKHGTVLQGVARAVAPAALVAVLAAAACAPPADSPEPDEILVTEDVGGAIDAELSTEEDPRGRRRAESSSVLPPGFPAELPLPAGASLRETQPQTSGRGAVVLASARAPASLMVDWVSLLEADGWSVDRSGELALSAQRGEQRVSAAISPAGSGSNLRITY